MAISFSRRNFLLKQFVGVKLCLALLCVVALILVPLQMVTAFERNVGLYDAKIDSGKVKVSVSSQSTNKRNQGYLMLERLPPSQVTPELKILSSSSQKRNFRLMEHFLHVCIQMLFMQINANMLTDIITLDQRAYGYRYRVQIVISIPRLLWSELDLNSLKK